MSIEQIQTISAVFGTKVYLNRDSKPSFRDDKGNVSMPEFQVTPSDAAYNIGTPYSGIISRMHISIDGKTGNVHFRLQHFGSYNQVEGFDEVAAGMFATWMDYAFADGIKPYYDPRWIKRECGSHTLDIEPKHFLDNVSVVQKTDSLFKIHLFNRTIGTGDYSGRGDVSKIRFLKSAGYDSNDDVMVEWHKRATECAIASYLNPRDIEDDAWDKLAQIFHYARVPANWGSAYVKSEVKFEPEFIYTPFVGQCGVYIQRNPGITGKYVGLQDGDAYRLAAVYPDWLISECRVSAPSSKRSIKEIESMRELVEYVSK